MKTYLLNNLILILFISCTYFNRESNDNNIILHNIDLIDTNRDLTLIKLPDKYKIYKDSISGDFIELEFYETKELKRKSRLVILDERINGGFKKYVKEGYSETYYKSGTIYSKEIYLNNYLHGEQTYFYPNNKISTIKYYIYNFKDSIWKYYDTLGQIIKTEYHNELSL